jgi:hypothetical protein
MLRAKLSFVLCAFCLTFVPVVGSADDFAPPPWDRSSPFAVTAEWEFFTPADPVTPDGPLTNVGTKGSGSVVTSADIFGPSGWGGTSGGNWFFPPSTEPQGMHFRVDNVIDFMPVKHLRLQVTHTPGLGLLLDPLAAFNFTATGSTTSLPLIISGSDPIHTLFVWEMYPNPPWEDFRLHVTSPGEIRQIVMDTISTVPEPSTACCALAFLTMSIAFRACPRFWKQALR